MPELSHPVTTAVGTGLLVDLAADWLGTANGVPPTFRRSGVYQGMSGAGITRIDTVLTNCIGAAVVTNVRYHWEGSSVYDHVPISVTLNHTRMQQQVWRAGRPIGIDTAKHLYKAQPCANAETRAKLKEAAAETYQAFWKPFEAEFAKAEAGNDYEETHRLWCLTAELWLYLSQIDDHDPWTEKELDGFYKRGVPRRGKPMPIRTEPLVPTNLDDSRDAGVIGIETAALKLCASIKGIVNLCKQDNQAKSSDVKISEVRHAKALKRAWTELQENIGNNPYEANAHVMKGLIQPVQSPHGELNQNVTTAELERKLRELLKIAQSQLIHACTKNAQKTRREMKEALSDPARGNAAFYKHLKADQYKPTTILQLDGKLTGDTHRIMDAFVEQWHGVYHRLQDQPPEYAVFEEHYGKFMPNLPTGDLTPNGQQLHSKATGAKKDSAAGSDAWRPAELALLPEVAWHHRARVLRVIKNAGRWPKSNHDVISPCLRKKRTN